MRKLLNDKLGFILGLVLGFIIFNQSEVVIDAVVESIENANIVMAQELADVNEVVVANTVNIRVDNQPDGDMIYCYGETSDEFFSFAIINEEQGIYEFYCPEMWEDAPIECESMEELNEVTGCHIYQAYGEDVELKLIEEEVSSADKELNPLGYTVVNDLLDNLSESTKELLVANEVQIIFNSDIVERQERRPGFYVSAFYNYDNNVVVMREDLPEIERSLIHELGHALDDILGLRYNDGIIDSYIEGEVTFTDNADYYNSCIEEYIAESIEYYYNGLLDESSVIYQELDYILGE